MSSVLRLVVLASGEGSNFQALLDAIESGSIRGARIEGLVCDVPGAGCVQRAVQHGIPSFILPGPARAKRGSPERLAYDERLAVLVRSWKPDYILLLGWMRLLSQAFLQHFPERVINLHPALPGTFPGTHAIERAFEAFLAGSIEKTGVMLHLVPDEGVDAGPVLRFAEVAIYKEDTLEILTARIHSVEHREVVAMVEDLARSKSINYLFEKEIANASRADFGL